MNKKFIFFVLAIVLLGLFFMISKNESKQFIEIKYLTECLGWNYSFSYNISIIDGQKRVYLLILTYKYPRAIHYILNNNTIKIIEETYEDDPKYNYEKCYRKVLIILRSNRNYTIKWYKKWKDKVFFNYMIKV